MVEEVLKKYDFKQLCEFCNLLKTQIIEYLDKDEKQYNSSKFIDLNAKLKNNLDLRIIILEDNEKDWITIYFQKGNLKLEQVEFMLLKNNEYLYNRVIRHDYFIQDDDIATTFNSAYCFIDNEFLTGGESIRKVPFRKIASYAIRDNLANFTTHIDSSKSEILYKENRDNLTIEPTIEIVSLGTSRKF